jgi:hypothetical protein
MRNEPNLGQSQIFITLVLTRNYNKKVKLDTWSKRTQTKPKFTCCKGFKPKTKPILPAVAGKIALSLSKGLSRIPVRRSEDKDGSEGVSTIEGLSNNENTILTQIRRTGGQKTGKFQLEFGRY